MENHAMTTNPIPTAPDVQATIADLAKLEQLVENMISELNGRIDQAGRALRTTNDDVRELDGWRKHYDEQVRRVLNKIRDLRNDVDDLK